MIYLTSSALTYATNICEELPKYSVVIIVHRRNLIKDVFDKTIIKGNEEEIIKKGFSKTEATIWFKNGSHIRIVPAISSFCGLKYHLLVVDPLIEEEALDYVFRPMETWEYKNLKYGF